MINLDSGTNAPALRFNDDEGEAYPEWKRRRLCELSEIISGVVFRRGETTTFPEKGRIPVLRAGNIGNELDLNSELVWLDSASVSIRQHLQLNDIVICTSSGSELIVGKSAPLRKKWEGTVGAFCSIIRSSSTICTPGYIAQFMRSPTFRRWTQLACGSNIKNLSQTNLQNYPAFCPSLEEQQKIANFLSSVDTRIEQLEKKKALFEQYKKGLMQKLFSQEIRFKDDQGEEYPEWKFRPFSEVYSFKQTKSLSRNQLCFDEDSSISYIHYGDIHTKFRAQFVFSDEVVPFVSSDVDIGNIPCDMYCQDGDLVIADASEDYVGIGKTIEIIDSGTGKIVAGLHTFLARPKLRLVYLGFAAQMMFCEYVRLQIKLIAQGTKVLGISTNRLKTIILPLPCIYEQQKIANFLSSVDRKIELITEQINQTRGFKKGLLQQMFI